MIHTFLFDLDGTLLDTQSDIYQALVATCQLFNIKVPQASAIRPFLSLGLGAIFESFVPTKTYQHLKHDLRHQALKFYQKQNGQNTQPFEHIQTILNTLNHHDIPWGIITNKLTAHTTLLLEKLGWLAHVKVVVCGDTFLHAKPHPMGIEHALNTLGACADNTLFMGDHAVDIQAGQAAKVKTALALWGYKGADQTGDQVPDYHFKQTSDCLNFVKAQIKTA